MIRDTEKPSKPKSKVDYVLLAITALLLGIGLIAIYDASVVSAFQTFHDKLYYFKNQLIWATLGTIALTIFSFIDYHKLLRLGPLAFGVSGALLLAVLIP